MNVFLLDYDLKKCAAYHCDKHIVKMPLELAQLVSTANRMNGKTLVDKAYKITHKNHPWAIWTRYNQVNYDYVCSLGISLCEEYTYRYNKRHACQDILESLEGVQLIVPDDQCHGCTDPPLCMPDEYKVEDPIVSYRNYYKFKKETINFKYTNRKEPDWL